MIKTAMIMAAGLGTRFGHYTELVPKGFVEVGGKPMIIRSIETLLSCGIDSFLLKFFLRFHSSVRVIKKRLMKPFRRISPR